MDSSMFFHNSTAIIFLNSFKEFVKDEVNKEEESENRIIAFIEKEITTELAEYIIDNAPDDIEEERTIENIRASYHDFIKDYIEAKREKKPID
ncbi:MAG: hypothetical protein ACEPOW_10060 [Bacteroidales bacterium]